MLFQSLTATPRFTFYDNFFRIIAKKKYKNMRNESEVEGDEPRGNRRKMIVHTDNNHGFVTSYNIHSQKQVCLIYSTQVHKQPLDGAQEEFSSGCSLSVTPIITVIDLYQTLMWVSLSQKVHASKLNCSNPCHNQLLS